MSTLLALDFGTQGLKAHLYDEAGASRAACAEAYPFSVNEGGHMQQSPLSWRHALRDACRILRDRDAAGFRGIAAIGITGQMHGVALLDAHGAPMGDVMVWCDTRAERQAQELAQTLPDPLRDRLRNPFVAAYTAPKLRWIQRHDPERIENAAKMLFCKDYMRYLLTGEMATDHSDASGSLLYDFARGDWSAEAMEALRIPASLFPQILSSADAAGRVTRAAQLEFGLPSGAVVAVGAGDLACGVLGSGLTGGREALINLGTAGQVLTLTPGDAARADGGYLFKYLDSDASMMLFAIPSAAYSLRWFLENVLGRASVGEDAPFERMTEWANACPPGARGLIFAPYLSGTGSPYLDDSARAAFIGLDAGHGRGEMVRAIMEGVAMGIRDCIERAGGPERLEQVFFAGGGAKSALWRQIMADVLGRGIRTPTAREATSLGAGILAARAVGLALSAPNESHMAQPIQQNAERYEALYARFARVYPMLREMAAPSR